jgi:isopenicillin N synthase-like dioxygenase
MILDSQELLENYMRNCHAVVDLVLTRLNTSLGLPDGTLLDLHKLEARSGDHVRFTRSPAQPFSEDIAKRGEHSDFGSITVYVQSLVSH